MHALEERWREAEAVAAIADGLLLPGDIDDRVAGLKRYAERKGIDDTG